MPPPTFTMDQDVDCDTTVVGIRLLVVIVEPVIVIVRGIVSEEVTVTEKGMPILDVDVAEGVPEAVCEPDRVPTDEVTPETPVIEAEAVDATD